MSHRGRFVRGLKTVKNVIAYSCSESLNSHKKTIKSFLTFFRKNSKSRGTPFGRFDTFWDFFSKNDSAKMKPLYSLNFRPKIRKILRAVFQKKYKKNRFDPVLTPFCPKKGSRGFFFKSLSVTFLHLSSPNCIQKIRKILRANSSNF